MMNELSIDVIEVEAIFTKSSIIVEVGNVRYTKQGLSKGVICKYMRG